LGTVFGAAVVGASIFTLALAIGSFDFPLELDGNAADGVPTGTDWNAEYAAGNLTPPGGAFIDDPVLQTADPIFTGGGSKDDNDVTGWRTTIARCPTRTTSTPRTHAHSPIPTDTS
jgi:hypothetical protein